MNIASNEIYTISPLNRIIQGLTTIHGVPAEYMERLQPGLVAFVKSNRSMLPDIVSTILDSANVNEPEYEPRYANSNHRYNESMIWLKWLMFEGDPTSSMESMAQTSGQRGVCGAIWGQDEIAFRCQTCEVDPECAICASCFNNGNHKNHDYSMIQTVGGCCDCGDETAWKREGFCVNHKGAQQIEPLSEAISGSVGPVLDALFKYWKEKLLVYEMRKVGSELTYAVVEMLLEFCKHSESLLSFVSKKLLSVYGLLSLLVRSERFLSTDVTKKLYELVMKLLSEPTFKYEFSKVFVDYYPVPLAQVLERKPLLSNLSVQIFTVPTLTLCLVKEWNLMGTLVDYLEDILLFCCGDDGELEFNEWDDVFSTAVRVMHDMKYVLSDSSIAKYVTQERSDIIQTWLQIVSLMQGMHPLNRETRIHVEEENKNAHLPFIMCNYIANIHFLLVKGAFAITGIDEMENESFPNTQKFDGDLLVGILPSVLKAINCWLEGSNIVTPRTITCSSDSTCPTKTGNIEYNKSTMGTENTLSLLSLYDWPHIDYDVSSQKVSVHMPLHRLLSLILKEAFRNYCVDKDELGSLCSSSSGCYNDQFFKKLLGDCRPYGFSSFLMEHPLRSRVFCSQVRAKMWRRNGDAAQMCFRGYRSIQWSDHQLELDLFLLQICAALAPADFYVKRLLERFQLSDFLTLDPNCSNNEYEPVLVQELLTLIIQTVKERRFSGFTPSENLQRELVCKLATGDATHSELVKSLPQDLSNLDQLKEVLDKVAQYSTPSRMNQGKYSLRLAYWKELDLYHPCWNPNDFEVAIERYSHSCDVSALSSQLPKWTNIYKPLIGIAKIATCQTVLHIIRAVLFHNVATDRSSESRAPHEVLITSLHLLSLGLDICSIERRSGHALDCNSENSIIPLLDLACEECSGGSLLSLLVSLMRRHMRENDLSTLVKNLLVKFAELDSKCMTTLQKIAPQVVDYQTDLTVELNSASETEKRKMKAREMQAAILAKMKAQQSKFLESLGSESDTGSNDSDIENGESASDAAKTHICCLCHDRNSEIPVSFLILLRKSRLVHFVDRGPPSWDQDVRHDESEIGCTNTSRNGKTTADVIISSSQLEQLIQDSIDEFAPEARPKELDAYRKYMTVQFPELHSIDIAGKSSDKRDEIVYPPELFEQSVSSSIQKEMMVNINDRTSCEFLIEENALESFNPDGLLLGKYIASLKNEYTDCSENSTSWEVESSGKIPSYDGFGPLDCDGVHVSSCGHAVHQRCVDRYLSSLDQRNTRTVSEFLCPVCRRPANSTLPTAPSDSHKLSEPIQFSVCSSPHSSAFGGENKFQLQHALSLLKTTSSIVSSGETLNSLSVQHNRRIWPNLRPFFLILGEIYFPGKRDIFSMHGRISPSVIMWDTLRYSLVSTEIISRRGLDSLSSECRASSELVLPLLLKIIQSSRTNNATDVLLRARGIQLFAASINSGVNYDKRRQTTSNHQGSILRILKQINPEIIFPDTLFWDQASKPVLTRDPFSTLMWILFCLPYPILSSKESFYSLVHLCYAVVISQAVITYCAHSKHDLNELGFHHCMVTDIAKSVRKSVFVNRFFLSNYVGPSCHIKDVVHRLSLPYLRRCSLLWKLLNSCSFFTSSSPDNSDGIKGVIDEDTELQNMFRIPSLDVLFKDELLRSTFSKWWFHLCDEFEDKSVVPRAPFYLTPSVPFKLMNLPPLYQDLVQRYIKPRCLYCNNVQDDPALCLLCGKLCSSDWDFCCSKSECRAHAMTCGAGTGIFLLIKRTTILLQQNAKHEVWRSPYLDAFGEEDIDLKRGKPLFLNEERYADLTYKVASHSLIVRSS